MDGAVQSDWVAHGDLPWTSVLVRFPEIFPLSRIWHLSHSIPLPPLSCSSGNSCCEDIIPPKIISTFTAQRGRMWYRTTYSQTALLSHWLLNKMVATRHFCVYCTLWQFSCLIEVCTIVCIDIFPIFLWNPAGEKGVFIRNFISSELNFISSSFKMFPRILKVIRKSNGIRSAQKTLFDISLVCLQVVPIGWYWD